MQENSWWTWYRADGSRYAPSDIDGLWMRVADRRWMDAREQFGPLADHAGLIQQLDTDPETGTVTHSATSRGQQAAISADQSDWKVLHYRLKAMAKLWQPWPDNADIYCLSEFNPLQHADASALRATLELAAMDGELMPRLDGWRLRVVPRSLRGYLLMTCAADVADQRRFRRCANCNEWFGLARSDTKHCSQACRQAFYAARKGVT